MPQMSPLNWLFLYNFTLLIFLMFNMYMYFFFYYNFKKKNYKKFLKFNWKW